MPNSLAYNKAVMKTPNTPKSTPKPVESLADFKHRIALIMRNREGGAVYSIIGAAKAHPSLVRPKEEVTTE